ncbi:MAG: hypothetical protein LBT51_08430 [Fusobacteriaceae bacterium]|jgi:hypothetical protein|nr:hypothetical protein [Fusobacteriaceae bacterium]
MENSSFENNNNNINNDNINDNTINDKINIEKDIEESDNLYLSFDMDDDFKQKMRFTGGYYQTVGILGYISLALFGTLSLFYAIASRNSSYMDSSAGSFVYFFIFIVFAIPVFLCSSKCFKGGSALKQSLISGNGKDLEVAIAYFYSITKIGFILFTIFMFIAFIGFLFSISRVFRLLY